MMQRLRLAQPLVACAIVACSDTMGPTASTLAPRAAVTGGGYAMSSLPFVPTGINDAGVMVGWSGNSAVRFEGVTLAVLPVLESLPGIYRAHAISSDGAIAGGVQGGVGLYWPSAGEEPTIIGLAAFGAVLPSAINAGHVVVGRYCPLGQPCRAFRWSPNDVFIDMTPPGFRSAAAVDINDAGDIVGYGVPTDGSPVRALRWKSGSPVLPPLPGGTSASAVHPGGDAVGVGNGGATPTLWPVGGGALPLAAPQQTHVDDYSAWRRVVGHTHSNAANPRLPWTARNGTITWLPIVNPGDAYDIRNLRVNACGTIVGQRESYTGVLSGVVWRRPACDMPDLPFQF